MYVICKKSATRAFKMTTKVTHTFFLYTLHLSPVPLAEPRVAVAALLWAASFVEPCRARSVKYRPFLVCLMTRPLEETLLVTSSVDGAVGAFLPSSPTWGVEDDDERAGAAGFFGSALVDRFSLREPELPFPASLSAFPTPLAHANWEDLVNREKIALKTRH